MRWNKNCNKLAGTLSALLTALTRINHKYIFLRNLDFD